MYRKLLKLDKKSRCGKLMKGPEETPKVDGRSHGCTKVDGSLPKVLHKHRMLTEGPVDTWKVHRRSRGCTKVDGSLPKVLRKHRMLTEVPMDARKVDIRFHSLTES